MWNQAGSTSSINNFAGERKRASSSGALLIFHLDGQGEIRTLDTLAGMPVFETGAFNHSATCPTLDEN